MFSRFSRARRLGDWMDRRQTSLEIVVEISPLADVEEMLVPEFVARRNVLDYGRKRRDDVRTFDSKRK